MSTSPRPSPLSMLGKAFSLAVPLIACLAVLVMIGAAAVNVPLTQVAEAEVTQAPAPVPAKPAAADTADTSDKSTGATTTARFSPDEKQQIETIIKDYLVTNPEIFIEVQTALEQKLEQQQAEKLKVAIAENATEIYRRPDASVAGNADGDITVVEFFDYNCGYCKRGLADIVKLVESDPNVRVVFKELPILSKGSQEAALAALAAKKQGKYWEMHRALLEAKGHLNEETALRLAAKIGLDVDKLKADMNSPEVKEEIARSEALAKKMGVNGTPHFLVGDRAIPGAPEDLYQQLAQHVQELRKEGCSYC